MNVSRLETIEQIREFLNGTVEVAFSNPAEESTLRTFVTTVIRRYRYFSGNLETRVLRTRSSPNWLCLLERPAHAGTFHGVVPTTLKKGNEHEQIYESIACYLALSIPLGVGSEVPIPDVARSGGQRGAAVRNGVLSTVGMRDSGTQRAAGSCAFVGEGATEAVDLGADGRPERTYRDSAVHGVPESAQEAVLG
jgi:hypothetical protein